jgi:hypothetical protein
METTLHRQFKSLYCAPGDQQEKEIGEYRIDVAQQDRLVEIQHSSLSAIRDKVSQLLENYRVLVVKPLVIKKRIVRLNRKGGQVVSRRWSPKQGHVLDLFDELIYFRSLFPHANLTLDVPLVQIEEWRYQGHGRRRRIRQQDYQIQDQLLLSVDQTLRFQGPLDLWQVIPELRQPTFTTQDLSEHLGIPRFRAQKIAYTLQHCQAAKRVGKVGKSFVYAPERIRTRTKRNVG